MLCKATCFIRPALQLFLFPICPYLYICFHFLAPISVITPLDHTRKPVAERIRQLFQASYAVEAKLLQAEDFPPLKRPLEGFTGSKNAFFGFYRDSVLAGAVEVDPSGEAVHIQSLVVHPEYFRQGIGRALVDYVLRTYNAPAFTVETGLGNAPATALYKALGFQEVRQWDTDHGVRKIRFRLAAPDG